MAKKGLDFYDFKALPFDLGRYDVERVGRDTEWAALQGLVTQTRQSKAPIFGVLLGTYGSGKSFMLWQLSLSLAPPTRSGVVACRPIRLIDPEQKRDFIKSLVTRVFSRGIDLEDLVPVVARAKLTVDQAPMALRPYVSLILALKSAAGAGVAWRVLSGGRALRREAEAAGFTEISQIRTNDEAISLLHALQLVLKSAGIDALAILVDEVEYVDALPKGQRGAVLDSLKHVWDQEVGFFSRGIEAAQLLTVLAATPSFWQQAVGKVSGEGARGDSVVGLVPFLQRIRESDVIAMPAELSQAEARDLIVKRMSEVRAGRKKEDLIPFTSDYVNYVYELSQGLPRRIIEICAVVINEAAQRGLKSINRTGGIL